MVTVVPVKLLHLATTKVVSVGQGMPNNTKLVLQKALEGGMRESKGRNRRHRCKGKTCARKAPLEHFCSTERISTCRDPKEPLRPQEVAQLAKRFSGF